MIGLECGCNVCWVAHDNGEVVLQVFGLVWVELGGSNHLALNAKWSPGSDDSREGGIF